MENTQVIKTEDNATFQVGAIQFGDDWPGTFLSEKFINKFFTSENFPSHSEENRFNNPYQLAQMMVRDFMKNVKEEFPIEIGVMSYKEEITQEIQKVNVKINNGQAETKRVETGKVQINNQTGYFIRGDNSFGLASFFNQLSTSDGDFYSKMSQIFNSSNMINR